MDESPPAEFILTLTEWILTHNVFVFEDNFFQQVKGTAMGACFAPNYANLFLGLWEEEFVFNAKTNPFFTKIKWWTRYIDDICMIFEGHETELLSFHAFLNSINACIKLSLEYNQDKINFLDITIFKDQEGRLHTSLFRKNTDRNAILHAKSFHPNIW